MTIAPRGRVTTGRLVVAGLLVSLLLAGIVSLWASGSPDGLEFVAEKLGFLGSGEEHASADSPFADYGTAGVDDARLSGGLAGVVGVVMVAVVAFGLMHLLRRRGAADRDDD